MKNNKFIMIHGVVILVLIAGWFYWFQYRPILIRKNCAEQTRVALNTAGSSASTSDINTVYNFCLHQKGM
jgi:hypothetical protein